MHSSFGRHLSAEASSRAPGSLRDIVTKFAGIDDVIGMHGGLPPGSVLPISTLTLTLTDGSTIPITDPAVVYSAQQYNLDPCGYPPLQEWAHAHTFAKQRPARTDMKVLLTHGASHSIELVLRTLLNPGDSILVEEFLYSHAIENTILPIGFKPLPVKMDNEGLIAESLERVVEDAISNGTHPRVLYTVPTAQNPTGAIMSLERKRAIYAVCQRHDIVIVEDDPYVYLQFTPNQDDVPGTSIEPGFLHLDNDGRVLRIDSFAKSVAPGFRLGWVTAAAEMIAPVMCAVQASTMGPAGPSQVIMHSILTHWGDGGFDQYIKNMQMIYKKNAAALHDALTEYVGALCEWSQPRAGMFLWLKVLGIQDAGELLDDLIKHKVVVVPGKIFHANMRDPDLKCSYIRLAFSYSTPELLREGAKRLGAALRAAQSATSAPAAVPAA